MGKQARPIDQEEKMEEALTFLFSQRGRYIVSQALCHALRVMGEVQPEVRQEKSNMDDMRYLRDMLFDFPKPMAQEWLRRLHLGSRLMKWIVKSSASMKSAGERESAQMHKLLPQNHGLGECGFDPGHEEVGCCSTSPEPIDIPS